MIRNVGSQVRCNRDRDGGDICNPCIFFVILFKSDGESRIFDPTAARMLFVTTSLGRDLSRAVELWDGARAIVRVLDLRLRK